MYTLKRENGLHILTYKGEAVTFKNFSTALMNISALHKINRGKKDGESN